MENISFENLRDIVEDGIITNIIAVDPENLPDIPNMHEYLVGRRIGDRYERVPSEQRQWAYTFLEVIAYGDRHMTVDQASWLYGEYLAEGDEAKCDELQRLIKNAKDTFRAMWPD